MRNFKLFFLIIFATSFSFYATAQENLNLTAPDIDPAPMGNVANNGSGCYEFKIQNVNLPGYPNAGDTEITILMENIVPADGITSLTSNLPESGYEWTYDGDFTIIGIQVNPIGFLYDELITVCFNVVGDSPCPTEDNGFTATGVIINGSDGNPNDNVATSYTCTLESIVPVTYGFFDASKKGRTSLLTWSTESEVNNDRFDVLRSIDGVNFERIGQVKGRGNSNQRQDYDFVDERPYTGKNYYRLSQVDFDETKHLSQIKTVEFAAVKSIAMFPNPATDVVQFELTSEVQSIQIFDVSGKKLKTVNLAQANSMEVKDLINGIYLVKFVNANGKELHSEKLLVSK